MRFGVFTYASADSDVGLVQLAQALEERGFESLFLPEHSHIPVSRRTPYPGGGDLPEVYKRLLDPLIGLAAVASVTERLLLGTAVCLPNERDLITLAKEVSTLDHLSGGRLVLGVGAGWNVEELENHGGNPLRRWATLRERVLAMKEIWAHDEAEFEGESIAFQALWQWPKPLQQPHPPILIGGHGPRTLDRVVEYADGWFPLAGIGRTLLEQRMSHLRRLAEENGRAPIPVTVLGPRPDPGAICRLAELGVERCVFWNLPDEPGRLRLALDDWASLMEKVG